MGSNAIFIVVAWPGFNMAGNVGPDNVKPVPISDAPEIVTATVPVDVNVTVCVADVLRDTSPNATLVALILSARIAAFNCRVKVFITLPAFAVNVTACAVATEDTVAVNPALTAFAGIVKELGTVTAELLLERLTLIPLLGAAAVSVTVHASVPDPIMVPLLQFRVPNETEPVPVPLRVIAAMGFVDELLVMVN